MWSVEKSWEAHPGSEEARRPVQIVSIGSSILPEELRLALQLLRTRVSSSLLVLLHKDLILGIRGHEGKEACRYIDWIKKWAKGKVNKYLTHPLAPDQCGADISTVPFPTLPLVGIRGHMGAY